MEDLEFRGTLESESLLMNIWQLTVVFSMDGYSPILALIQSNSTIMDLKI